MTRRYNTNLTTYKKYTKLSSNTSPYIPHFYVRHPPSNFFKFPCPLDHDFLRTFGRRALLWGEAMGRKRDGAEDLREEEEEERDARR